jgi:hypothetical protein
VIRLFDGYYLCRGGRWGGIAWKAFRIGHGTSGQSRGWIRKTPLEFPDDTSAAKSTGNEPLPKSAELFRVTQRGNSIFPGNREPLRGKNVKLYSVQPAVAETQARDKRNFAEELFERALQESSVAESPLAGGVVIFDSADGGQASTNFTALKWWREGKISEAAFWQSCSLDPPETFSVTAKKQ